MRYWPPPITLKNPWIFLMFQSSHKLTQVFTPLRYFYPTIKLFPLCFPNWKTSSTKLPCLYPQGEASSLLLIDPSLSSLSCQQKTQTACTVWSSSPALQLSNDQVGVSQVWWEILPTSAFLLCALGSTKSLAFCLIPTWWHCPTTYYTWLFTSLDMGLSYLHWVRSKQQPAFTEVTSSVQLLKAETIWNQYISCGSFNAQ